MKKLAVIAAVVGLVGAANAAYYINYSSYWGNYLSDGTTPIAQSGPVTVQLLYAGANGVADEFSANQLKAGSLVAGDDVLLYSATYDPSADSGNPYANVAGASFGVFDGTAYLGDGIYGRIFNNTTLGVGTEYYIGHVATGINDLDSGAALPPSPQDYNLTPSADFSDSVPAMGVVVVPEPATLGLMGVAGLGLFLARRKTRR